jgi:hypothetical protein
MKADQDAPLDGRPLLDDPAATSAAAVPSSGRGQTMSSTGKKSLVRLRKQHHGPTSADAPRPAHMGFNPAVGLLARGLWALAFPGFVAQWLCEDPSPLTVAGAAPD